MVREYPAQPLIGVGAVIVQDDQVLLVQRGREPGYGLWSLPGGLVELGETLAEAVRREVREECGLEVEVGPLIWWLDRIQRDPGGRVRYHYVLLDFLARPVGGTPRPGGDVLAVRWVGPADLAGLPLTPGLAELLQAFFAERRRPPDLCRAERPIPKGAGDADVDTS